MYSSNWYRLIILLVTIILPWLDVVLAKVTFSGSDEDVNYPSADFFPLSSSDHYSGVALKWNYEHDHHHDGPSCFFPSVNASDPYIMRFAYALSKHRNIALLISYQMSMAASCKGKEQVNRSMDILFEQLEEAGLPSVSALILSPGHGEHSMLRDDYIRYNYVDPFSESIQKHELAVSVIKTDDIPHKYGNVASDYITYEIAIEHEPNHINGPYLPARMIAYKWILFAITFLMLSYTWARIVNLIRMQELRWNALSASFFVTSIGCILLLVYLISLCGPNTTRILVYIYSFLSRISFNLVLWHWSTIGKNLFTKNPIILFRIIVIIMDVVISTIHVILMLFVFDQSTSTPYEFYLLHSYNSVISIIALLMTWKHIIIFGGFVFWFSWNAHNLNKHPKGRTRFIKLVYFSVIAVLSHFVYAVFLVLWIDNHSADLRALTDTTTIMIDITDVLQLIVLLSLLGLRWPGSNQRITAEFKPPLGGMTTIGWEMTSNEEPLRKRVTYTLTRFFSEYKYHGPE